jgi:hypothetical protein
MVRSLPLFRTLVLFCVAFAPQALIHAQITVSAIPGDGGSLTLTTGSFASLTATQGATNVTDSVTWTSSNPTAVPVSSTGQIAALQGTMTPVVITATLGTATGTYSVTVTPQTALYTVDGQYLYVYDITFGQTPALVTKVQYSKVAASNSSYASMAISEDGTTLYVANRSERSNSQGDFLIAVFNINGQSKNPYTLNTIKNSDLCYPSGMAVKNQQLFLVNEGLSGHNSNYGSGACVNANIQIYNEGDLSIQSTIYSTTAQQLLPIGAGASVDPNDFYVYVADPVENSVASFGTIHVIDSNPNDSTFDTIVANISVPISAVAVTVGTAYSSTGATTNTVYFEGPASSGSGYSDFLQALRCVPPAAPSTTPKCTVYGQPTSLETSTNPTVTGYNGGLQPVSMVPSPDGNEIYIGDSSIYVPNSANNPVAVAQTGTSTSPSNFPIYFNPFSAGLSDLAGIAVNASGSTLYGVSYYTLDWGSAGPFGYVFTNLSLPGVSMIGLAVSQNPEAQLVITHQTPSSNGTVAVTGQITVNGNFQDVFNNNAMGFQWGDTNSTNNNINANVTTPSGSTTIAVSNTFEAAGNFKFTTSEITEDARAAVSASTVGIIGTVPVGPVTVKVSPASSPNPISLIPGAPIQFKANVTPGPNSDTSVVWEVNGVAGGGSASTVGAIVGAAPAVTDPAQVYSAVYTAPTSGSFPAITVKAIANASPNGCTTTTACDVAAVTVSGPTIELNQLGVNQSGVLADFGSEGVTTTPTAGPAETVTVTNTGNAPLSLNFSITSGGTSPAPGDFALVTASACPASLVAGASCSFGVTFAPSATGERTATLSFTDIAYASPQTLSLSGFGVSPPDGVFSPLSQTFTPSVNVGQPSSSVPITLTNTGQANLVLGSTAPSIVGTNARDFSISPGTTTCLANLSVAQNASCVVSVVFAPTAAGNRTATLTVTDNSGGITGTAQTVQLTGTGIAVPTGTFNPIPANFPLPQTVGQPSNSLLITLTNTGQANLVLGSVAPALGGTNAGDFSIASGTTCTANLSIAPNSSCALYIVFTPTASGSRTAMLTVTDNSGGTTGTAQTIQIGGTGQTVPTGALNPTSITFTTPQTMGQPASPLQVTLTNTGQANLVLGSTALTLGGADPADFSIGSGTTCAANLSLAQNASCSIYIVFTSTALGSRTANLVITDNSGGTAGTTQSVPLSGTGISAAAGVFNPTTAAFTGQQTVGQTTSPLQVTLTNTGQANLVLGATALAIGGTNPGDFSIASGTTCAANLSIAQNSSCVINITFTPTGSGARAATLIVIDNSGGSTGTAQTLPISGTGKSLSIPTGVLSPASATFSTPQTIGQPSSALQVTLSNGGQANLVLGATALSLGGANPGDFSIASGTTCAANLSIAPNSTCVINIVFSPTATGSRTATLNVTDNSGGTAGTIQPVQISGTGISVPSGLFNPASVTFPAPQPLSQASSTLQVTLTNSGQAALVLGSTAPTLSGANPGDFSITQGTTCAANLSLAQNSSCVFNLVFTPTAFGARTATLLVTDNSGGTAGTVQSLQISGTGQNPLAVLSAASLTFPGQGVSTSSAAQMVVLTNTGNSALTLAASPISLSGADPGDYSVATATTCSSSLSIASNGTCAISIVFSPTSTGTRTATLSITDNSGGAAGTTQMVALSGTGTGLPQAALTPSTLTFATQNLSTVSNAQTVTLTNTGLANLSLSATPLSISGSASADFAVASGTTCTPAFSLAPNSSCVIHITFAPTLSGSRSATLSVSDNSGGAAGSVQTVALTGTGVNPITISLFPTTPDVEVATTQQFTAIFQPSSGAGSVIWTVSGTACNGNPCGTVSSSGLYSAPATLSATAADTVTATLASDTTVHGSTLANLFLKPVMASTSGQTETVSAGQSATYNLSLAGGTGDLTKPLTIACHTTLLPTGVTCPSVMVEPSASATNFTFTVATTGPQTTASLLSNKLALWAFLLPVGALSLFRSRRRLQLGRQFGFLMVILVSTFCLFFASGCGTNGSLSQAATTNFSQTPTGVYTIQLDGTGPSGVPDDGIGYLTLVVK